MERNKPAYGPRKTKSDYSDHKVEEVLYDQKPSIISKWTEAIRLLIILAFKLLNPLNWKKVYQLNYNAWLVRTNQHEKLLDFWTTNRPKTPAGEVIRLLKITDCHIQLGNYTDGINSLKGLADKIDITDKDDDWKEEKRHLIKLYRTTIYNLAKIQHHRKSH